MSLPMDCELHNIPVDVFRSDEIDGDEYARCSRCGYGGCDVRVSGCSCTLHAVSFPLFRLVPPVNLHGVFRKHQRSLYAC